MTPVEQMYVLIDIFFFVRCSERRLAMDPPPLASSWLVAASLITRSTSADANAIQNLVLYGIMITQTYFYITTFKEYVGCRIDEYCHLPNS
jgi:hypothetical protein